MVVLQEQEAAVKVLLHKLNLKNKTAILIFANSEEKELISKSVSSSGFFELLNSETLKIVKQTGLPYFHVSEKQQIGNSFGERFTNTIDSIFNKGFDTIISVGNDIPHLSAKIILQANRKLAVSDYVLGPSTDGGFYLMGFKKTHFNKISFQNLPWQTSKLRRSLNKELQLQNIKTLYLEMLSDIDEISDIQLVLKSFRPLDFKIKKILLTLQNISKSIISLIEVLFYQSVFKQNYNKGSPIFLHV